MGEKWVKKTFFQTSSLTIWGAQTGEMTHFEPISGEFGPSEVQKSLESGPRGDGDHLQADSTLSTAFNV